MKSNALLAIPTFRCEKQIERVLKSLNPEVLNRLRYVVVIDNRSPDQTVQTALRVIEGLPQKQKFKVFINDKNHGLGGSQKIAFQMAQDLDCDFVGILHGDDQAESSEVLNIIEEIDAISEGEAFLGSRFMRGSRLVSYSRLRTVGNKALNILCSLVFGKKVYDLGSGLNFFRVALFKDQTFLDFSNDLTFNFDLIFWLLTQNKKIEFIPITWKEEDQVSNAKIWKIGWACLKKIIQWKRTQLTAQSVKNSVTQKTKQKLTTTEVTKPIPAQLNSH